MFKLKNNPTPPEQKGVIHLIPLFLLLAGIIAGVYLVQHPQIFKPRAAAESFEFITGNCVKDKDGRKVLTCKGPIQFKLISPLESGSTSDASFQIVKTVYAQTTGGKDYFCDPNLQDKTLIFHKECSAFFDLFCHWGLFGAKWKDIGERCDIGQECQPISQFEAGARCKAAEQQTDTFPTTPFQPVSTSQPSSTNLLPRQVITPPPEVITPPPAARSTPSPTSSAVQPTVTPRPTTPAAASTPTPTSTPQGGSTSTPSKNATLTLFPSSWTANKGCNFSLQVRVNTAAAQTSGTDVTLLYDPSRLTATAVTAGSIYQDYPGNYIDPMGKVLISGLARSPSSFTGLGIFAIVNFIVKEDAPEGPTQVRFDFDPNDKVKTTDSNVVEKGTNADLLTTVSNSEYTIATGVCPAGTVGTGQTNPKGGSRTTTHYRFAENPAGLKEEWLPYTAGGVTITHTFSKITPGQPNFIFAQFKDSQGNIINAKPYPVQIAVDTETSTTPIPSREPTTRPTATPIPIPSREPTTRPTATPIPTSANCEAVREDIANWRSCSREGLKNTLLTLSQSTRDQLPNEALIIFNNSELLQLFSKNRLALLPTSYLANFGNGDLLAVANASGSDLRTFFSNFSCDRIVQFSQEVQNQIGLCQ